MQKKEIETFCPASQQEWRRWLQENHELKQGVWLVYYKIKSGMPTLTWSQAVDEALCFGWIDSIKKSIDEHTFMQFFSKRKPTSVWSKINKIQVEDLTQKGLMARAGFASIATAKQNGSWNLLDTAEDLQIPVDLVQAFERNSGAKEFFLSLSKSVRKSMLQWLLLAKQPTTRQKRINEISELAAQKVKPKQF